MEAQLCRPKWRLTDKRERDGATSATVCTPATYINVNKSNLAKGRIAVLSPIAAANTFVRFVRRAGTFARGGRRTVRNALMRRYITTHPCARHTDRQTDRHIDHSTCDICSNRPHLYTASRQCGLIIITATTTTIIMVII